MFCRGLGEPLLPMYFAGGALPPILMAGLPSEPDLLLASRLTGVLVIPRLEEFLLLIHTIEQDNIARVAARHCEVRIG